MEEGHKQGMRVVSGGNEGKEADSPWSLQEKYSPANTLMLIQWIFKRSLELYTFVLF